jgi:hypothetical protein
MSSISPTFRAPRRFFVGALTLLIASVLTLAVAVVSAPVAEAATRKPVTPTGLPSAIEPLASYVPDNSCAATAQPGTVKLAKYLTSTYSGTSYLITRPCGSDGLSSTEHYDGRAVDWMNSIRNTRQAAQAKAVLDWLFAKDKAGNPYAMARRLGVMYIIWNNKIWGAYSAAQGWRPYSSCASHPETGWDTTCHRNHMHISLSWEGSQGRTSFWSKKVAAVDYGPCRAADLNWAKPYRAARSTRCPSYPAVKAPAGSSALMKSLVKYSGMDLRKGATGPAVSAVQQAVGAPVTGRFDAKTVAVMEAWKRSRDLGTKAAVTLVTWRALLKANAPKSSLKK